MKKMDKMDYLKVNDLFSKSTNKVRREATEGEKIKLINIRKGIQPH